MLVFTVSCTVKKITTHRKSSVYYVHFHEGVRRQITGDYEKSISEFEKCLELEHNDDASLYGIALCLEKQNQAGAAINYMEKACHADPNNQYYSSHLAYLFQINGEFSKAAQLQESLIKIHPENEKLYFDAAMNYANSRDTKKALKILDKLSKNYGNSIDLVIYKYNIINKVNPNSTEAIDLLEKANREFPNDPGILSYLIDYYMAKGNYRKGTELLEKLVIADPENSLANLLLGDLTLESGNKEKAFAYYKLAIGGEGLSSKTIVETFIKMKDVWIQDAEILKLMIESEMKFPNDPMVSSLIGDFYYQKKEFDITIQYYKKTVTLNPDLGAVWNELIALEFEQEDWVALKEDAKTVTVLYPLSPLGFYLAGTAMNKLKEFNTAQEYLEEGMFLIVQDDQLKGEFKSQLAESAVGKNDRKKAISLYEEAMKLSPDDVFILRSFFLFYLFKEKNFIKATELILKLKKLDQNENRQQEWLALLNFAEQKYKEAMDITLQIESTYINYNVILELQGDVLFFQNKKDQAIQKWKEAKIKGLKSSVLDLKILNGKYYDPL